MCKKKLIQVPVVKGFGEEEFFVEKEICIAPPAPPVYKVKDIKKWVEIADTKVIKDEVVFNAFLWKDITYKTVERVGRDFVSGPVFHYTIKIPFGGFVPVCGKVREGDKAELLEAKIEGEVDEWGGTMERCGVKVYTKLDEKTVIKLKFKVTRVEEVCIEEKKDCDVCKKERESEEEYEGCPKAEYEEGYPQDGFSQKEYPEG